ncbi:MAG: alpha/beta fold hydrolase [Nitrospinaceae bacterium]|nr:alpha/beta fold hydrolase [Nitrospina sp.]MBT5376879.1 alpha/beta fold hydrolase [Nitrospinaceae bacterium]MBT5869125.1 alpha/beta fold hydrolase [Nitrospinaceae bacterium]MBT6346449.1 alpha/beta fold hydrolase [Nitrospina sp.]
MVHGNPTWSFYYRNLILGFKNTHRCVVPDHMGMGKSDKPQNYPYTLSQHIDNLEKLADHLKLDDITLVVHDWGGAIGMGFAIRHPERIRRLVIFNTAAFLSQEIPLSLRLCRLPGFGAIAIRGFNAFARCAVRWACVKQERMTDAVQAGYLAPYDNFSNRVANLRFVQDIPMNPDSPSYPVVKEIEEKLQLFREHPVQIIWGAQDFVFNDHFLKRWQEIYPQAEVHRMADAGHYVLEDAHEKIIPMMQNFFEHNPL